MRPQCSVGFGETFTSSRTRKNYVSCSWWSQGNARNHFKKSPEERVLVVDSGASMLMMSKKNKLRRSGHVAKVQQHYSSVDCQGEMHNREEAQAVQLLEETPAVLSLDLKMKLKRIADPLDKLILLNCCEDWRITLPRQDLRNCPFCRWLSSLLLIGESVVFAKLVQYQSEVTKLHREQVRSLRNPQQKQDDEKISNDTLAHLPE